MFNWIKKLFTQKEHNVRDGSLVRVTQDDGTYPEVDMGKGYIGKVVVVS